MSQNCLQLNQDKTKVLIIGSKAQREKLASKLNTPGLKPRSKKSRSDFWLWFLISRLMWGVSQKQHFIHLKNISKVTPFLSLSINKLTKRRAHIMPILKSLHRLPVSFHIDFKILLLVYMALHGLAPDYLSEMLLVYEPGRRLKSTGSSLLAVLQSRTRTFGDAAFSRYAPNRWNSLPEDLRGAENIAIFKSKLKTHLCSLL